MKLACAALFAAALAALASVASPPVAGQESGKPGFALAIDIDGAIGPASARYLNEALTAARERQAAVVILRLNTPGGLVTSMREMIADIIASPVPVIGYVTPSGGHAASAGTYILYATHIAAMAPGTNIGAATPVEIGGPPSFLPGGKDGEEGKDKGAPGPQPQDTMAAKITNDSVAFIRSLAELRGRNADWAESAVRQAASLSASAALKERVIDLIAGDTTELLALVDGKVVQTAGGRLTLATKGLRVEMFEPGLFIQLLSVITDPNTAVILMLVGVYGIAIEFMTPGAVAPGVIGTISLLLGLYGLNLLPIDYAGLGLMVIGIAFLVAEAINPTVVLGLGGVTAFLFGAAMLLRVEAPGYHISLLIMGSAAAATLGLALLAGSYVWATRKNPPRVGAASMRGVAAEILDWSGGKGHARAEGERWRAEGEGPFMPGERVEVIGVRGLTLQVRRRAALRQSDGEGS
ncbi:nodulation protein NfeD [Mesorhizobium sp. BAC0120]|uniref:NfeD family protein n=1 Tax=Mesorhizobium sp. BAC0120 TaxID=3090670 RepID=UPI00298C4957|nr:nodulation protein NfeD [Mesorhizobium sp. BAC0120]MDW6025872.1 nodulation protein NfeD [Mesorhizobium sp. BAC0120]